MGAAVLLGAAACGTLPGLPKQAIVPAGPRGGIAGFIRDEAGRPVVGAFVAASCQVTDIAITSDEQGWYDLGQAGLNPGPCSIKGGSADGAFVFFGDVNVVAGTSQRVDFVARR